MLVLGPNIVRDGLDPATSLIASGSMAMLGPNAPADPGPPDPIHRIFLLTGKILAVRRVIMPERPGGPSELAIETLERLQVATLVSGH